MLLLAVLAVDLLEPVLDLQNLFIQLAVILQQRLQIAKLVDVADVVFRQQQLVVVLLPVDVDEQRGNLPQQLDGCRTTVDFADVSSVPSTKTA